MLFESPHEDHDAQGGDLVGRVITVEDDVDRVTTGEEDVSYQDVGVDPDEEPVLRPGDDAWGAGPVFEGAAGEVGVVVRPNDTQGDGLVDRDVGGEVAL